MTDPQPNRPILWKAKNAWQCVLALILTGVLVDICLRLVSQGNPAFGHWLKSPSGLAFSVIIQGGLWCCFAFLFSGAASTRELLAKVGLRQWPIPFSWCFAVVSIGIALLNSYGSANGWTSSSRRPPIGYDYHGGAWLFFAVKSVLIVPFYEEVVMRGFLYRAFRGSHGAVLSTGLIICISTWFHWGSLSRSAFTMACLIALWILLCIVRESTNSLWNCLFCHSLYNAFVLGLWLPSIIGILLLLAFNVVRPVNLNRCGAEDE